MSKAVSLLFALFLLACQNSHSQDTDVYFSNKIDSLDQVHALNISISKPKGCAYVISVRNQKEFNAINESIKAAIETGEKNIRVKIKKESISSERII